MPVEINVKDEDIVYAENILLAEDQQFDDERIDFIKNFDTIDLQAVPGSGKTTVLLAKLLILEKYLPFKDGSGILVISHTNAAVDEIKLRIGKHCPKLFTYPNFVGTIQSFVDTYLAIPYYTNWKKKKPYRIDNEIYDSSIESYIELPEYTKLLYWLKSKHDYIGILKKARFDNNLDLIPEFQSSADKFLLKNKSGQSYKAFKRLKSNLLEWGHLHFDDAYLLANRYIEEFPNIKTLLQKRFSNVFVDEMQDMGSHQYELLEGIFFDGGSSNSKYQRIGDKNQAIFSREVNLDDIWQDRSTTLQINGSYRLTSINATIVKPFGLSGIGIDGRNSNDEDKDPIKPHIIVYDDDSIEQVIPKYAELIKGFQESGLIPQYPQYPFKAIAWRKYIDDPKKIALKNYWPTFEETEHNPKTDYQCLISYLIAFDKKTETLEAVRKYILNAVLKIFRMENILDNKGRNYTKRKLINFLIESHFDFYEEFKLKIYQWSIGVIRGKTKEVVDEIRQYIPDMISKFGETIDKSSAFINDELDEFPINVPTNPTDKINVWKVDGLEIEITTVHSAKGQTHTTTLYLESNYTQRSGIGYESQRLDSQFKGEPFSDDRKLHQQSTKMVYVGLSRPTHLLCFGVHKDRFEDHLNDVDENVWEVVKTYQE